MLTRPARLALIDREDPELPIKTQAELLGLNRSGIYYQPVPISERELQLRHRIDEIYTQLPFYGSRRITKILQREGWQVGREVVQGHMRAMGIAGICPGPNLSKRDHQHRVYPYRLRRLCISRPNQVWGIDITYIRLARGWMYLAAILDWYSRYLIAWKLHDTLEVSFVLVAVDEAFSQAIPEIMNSDQGSQFTSEEYTDRLKGTGVLISMDSKGRALDNVFTERFWRNLKYEEVYVKNYQSPREARQEIARYIDFYNRERPHQSLGYRTPFEVYTAVPDDSLMVVVH